MNDARSIIPAGPRPTELARRDHTPPAVADRLDLSESLSFFRRRLVWILAGLAIAVVCGLAISLLMPKTYTAQASVMLTQPSGSLDDLLGQTAAPTGLTGDLVDTQVEVIQSRDMATRVAEALGWTEGLPAEERREVLDYIQSNIAVERSGSSYALSIQFDAESPEAAAAGANEFARQFANWEVSADREQNRESRRLVEARLSQLRDQAQEDTRQLQQYRINNNLLSTTGATMTEQEISSYNQQVVTARAEAAEAEARLRTAQAQLQSGSSGDDTGEALGSAVVSNLRAQEAVLAGQVANLSSRYGANHPQLIRAQNELQEVRSQIQSEIGRVISNLRAEREVANQRLASLNSSLSGASAKLSDNNASMVGLIGLERAAEASQTIYETYLNRYNELLAAEGSEQPNARILTTAEIPVDPSAPNIPLNLVLSVVIGLGLGVVMAYIAEALFQGITTGEQVRQELGQNFLASIPLLKSIDSDQTQAVAAIREDPMSLFTESFRALAASIDQASASNAQVIAITSAMPGEGKTVMSCCLAHVFAHEGERTMLIDCDIRRRGITRLLNCGNEQTGLLEILRGEVPFDPSDQIGSDTFCVVPIPGNDSTEESLLTGPAFADFINELRTRFDRIVLDLPPILPVASARRVCSQADSVVLAAQWRKTSTHAVKAALSRLPREHCNLVGVALNQVDMRKRAFLDRSDAMFYYDRYSEYFD